MADGPFPTLTPYIVTSNAVEAIAFYEKALGAVCRNVAKDDDGKVMNAQLEIGDSVLMLNDEYPDYGVTAPTADSRQFVTIHYASKNIHADWDRAVDAGMIVTMPLEDQFWGDRYGQLKDPYGYNWSMAQPTSEIPA